MATKDEIEAENAQLKVENERLRAELADARANVKPVPNTRPQPQEPSFGLSEGERLDREEAQRRVDRGEVTKVTVTSPFTGKPTEITKGAGDKRAELHTFHGDQ